MLKSEGHRKESDREERQTDRQTDREMIIANIENDEIEGKDFFTLTTI